MAANKEELNKSEELKKNVDLKKTLDVSSHDKFITNVIKHTNTFLTTPELARFRQASKKIKDAGTLEALARKKLQEDLNKELLQYVFQADPKKVAEFFGDRNSVLRLNSILVKTTYSEGYHSNKLNRFVLFRVWPSISPLQAAAICGDNFLVRHLLTYIIKKEKETNNCTYRLKAAAQLQEIITSKYYLVSFNELIKAYEEYNQIDLDACSEEDNVFNILWEKVGECYKRLSRYGLQEFFDGSHRSDDIEPKRGELRDSSNNLFDFDSIGIGTSLALLKGRSSIVSRSRAPIYSFNEFLYDVLSFTTYYQLYKSELEKIIDYLKDPQKAVLLIPADKDDSQKQKP